MTHHIYSIKRHYAGLALMLAALLTASTAPAKPRTGKQMRTAAISILSRHGNARAAAAATETAVKEITRSEGYVIYGREGCGFAVIATDDVAPEVLGYSDSDISHNASNANFKWWLDAVDDVVKNAAKTNTTIKRVTKPDPSKYDIAVSSLCSSRWGQEEPYWNMCPNTSSGRCLTGCVATSTAQVLYFHKGPQHGVGTRTIYYPANNTSGTPVTANFENDNYDWANMLDTYNTGSYSQTEANAVALLMRDCGVSTEMDYSPSGSGAYHDQTAEGLRKYFGLEQARYVTRRSYSESEWMEMIYDQIMRDLPIIYGGDDWQGGHSFVLDGYDSEGRVHINWGWEGSDDGYYDIALLNPSGYQFSRNQDAVIDIMPEPAVEMVSDTIKLQKAGTLSSVIAVSDILRHDTLRVEGEINSSDLKTLRMMANRDEYGEPSGGTLRVLDLKDATFTAGGDAYLNEAGIPLKIKEENVLPTKAFYGCSLRWLLLPKGIKSIGPGALAECNKLDSVLLLPADDADFMIKDNIIYSKDGKTITASLPRISSVLDINGDVTAVGDYAFSARKKIKKLTLGSQLESIGKEAFASCSSIDEIKVISKTPVPISGDGAFSGIDKKNCKLYVRAGNTAKFKAAAQWSDFSIIAEYGTTVKARNAIREYGEENPRLGYSINGDHVDGVPEVSCDATPTTPAGRYPIHIKPGTITDEAVDYEDGFLIITKAPLNVGVEDAAREEGEENPEFALTFEGFKNQETKDVLTVLPVATCEADKLSAPGTYPIIVSGGEAENYEFSYTNGTLTVIASTGIDDITGSALGVPFNVYTINGKLVATAARGTTGLPKGVYIIEMQQGSEKSHMKVVVR